MRKKHEYILMYQDDEVFFFSITFGKTNKIEVLEKLNHFDKAPYGINENTSMEDVKRIFKSLRFIPAKKNGHPVNVSMNISM